MANISKQIRKSKGEIQDVMQFNLAKIAESMIDQIVKNMKKLPRAQILNATNDIKPRGVNDYKSDLLATIAVVSFDALTQARSEVPKASKVKLMENEGRLLFGEFERLPSRTRKRIKKANKSLIGTQIADLQKILLFQFTTSVANNEEVPDSEEGEDVETKEVKKVKLTKGVKKDLKDAVLEFINGPSITSGSSVTAANTVNEARNAFFFDKKTLEQIEAFQFMNGDPVSVICNDLAGLIFNKNDPNAFRYTPPLHYNCKSWIRPIVTEKELKRSISRNKDDKKRTDGVEKFEPSTKKIAETIQFSDTVEACGHCCQEKSQINL